MKPFKSFSTLALALALLSMSACQKPEQEQEQNNQPFQPREVYETPQRPEGQSDVIELRADPIDTVRMAIIGLGMRGLPAVQRHTHIEGSKIVALADVVPEKVEKAQQVLKNSDLPAADGYTDPEGWKEICQRDDIDLVYITTNWELHTPIAVYAMEHGKHVATEVPAALNLEQCWKLVNTAEKTQQHCMMLENCNYDFFEMATLNMAKQGKLGEIVHAEGAYIHDLRALNFREENGYWNMWRLDHLMNRDANLYPTHGLGPIAHALNIHRGDKMEYLVSVSSDQFGMTKYAEEKFGEDSEYAQKEYKKGDMNTSIIKTRKGKTMVIQHDVTSPRPYSRIHMLSGTEGFVRKWPKRGIALEPNAHHFLPEDEMQEMLDEYEHPITEEVGEKAREVGGHGGMDFIMDYRLIYCLNNGLPLDQDVYDAAEWSAIVALTEESVRNNGMPVKVPDFTRGAWKKVDQVTYYTKD